MVSNYQRNKINSIADGYNSLAEEWDRRYENPTIQYRRSVEFNIISKNIKRGNKALDLGCGTGRHTFFLLERGCNVIGVDISPKMLEVLKRKAEERKYSLSLFLTDCNNLPFKTESFDVVISIYGPLTHLQNPANCIQEIMRVLKKGGKIVIGVENKWALLPLIRRVLKFEWNKIIILFREGGKFTVFKKEDGQEVLIWLQYYSLKQLIKLFRNAGFIKIKTYGGLLLLSQEYGYSYKKNLSFFKKILIWLEKRFQNHAPFKNLASYLFIEAEKLN